MTRKDSLLASRLAANKRQQTDPQREPDITSPNLPQHPFPKKRVAKAQVKETASDENQLQLDEIETIQAERKTLDRWRLSTRILNIVLVTACIYVLFLIYGVLVTDYQYVEDGTIKAERLSISDLAEKKSYESIYYQYLNCRALYEKTLILDYRLGAGQEDPLTIAPEYEALLEEVTDLSVKTDALEVDTQYSQIKNMLLSWIKSDIAVYLQNMSAAIAQNNEETANNALQDKDRTYSNFSTITQNIAAMGETVKGADLTSLKEWTPENYVDTEIHGK